MTVRPLLGLFLGLYMHELDPHLISHISVKFVSTFEPDHVVTLSEHQGHGCFLRFVNVRQLFRYSPYVELLKTEFFCNDNHNRSSLIFLESLEIAKTFFMLSVFDFLKEFISHS